MAKKSYSLTPALRERLEQEILRQGKTLTAASKAAGRNQHFAANIVSGDTDNPGVRTLDDLLHGLGFESFVHFTAGQAAPPLDVKILQRSVRNALKAWGEPEDFISLDWIAAATAVMYVAETDPGRPNPGEPYDPVALAWRTFQLLGPMPRDKDEERKWRLSGPATDVLG